MKDIAGNATAFIEYNRSREVFYGVNGSCHCIATRLVMDNFPFYASNAELIKKFLSSGSKADIKELNKILKETSDMTLEDYTVLENYLKVITQTDIDKYNVLISGIKGQKDKRKGINECIGEYNNSLPKEEKRVKKIAFLKTLYKLPLFELQRYSFIPEKFETDKELLDAMTAEIKLEPSISVKRKHRIGPCGKIAIFVAGYIAVAFIILYLAVLILTNGVL